MIQWMLVIWSLVPLHFLNPAWTSGSSQFMYFWSLAWRILSITLVVCEMSAIVRYFELSLALPFIGIGVKTDLFQSYGHCWKLGGCWGSLMQPIFQFAGQEATVRTRHGTKNWFKTRKEVRQDYILSSCLFNLYTEYIMWNARLDESQTGIKIARRNINNRRYADDATLMAESEELKGLLMKVKEEWKSWLKTQHSEN